MPENDINRRRLTRNRNTGAPVRCESRVRCGSCARSIALVDNPRQICQQRVATKDATWRLMRRVSQMITYAQVSSVAAMMSLGESTVHRYDMAVLREGLPAPNLDG